MQVKRRINQFFGNILRKDKDKLEEESQGDVPSSLKKKTNKKSNQSYSQWDLMEHIAVESERYSKNFQDENAIYSDGLALHPLEVHKEEFPSSLFQEMPNKNKSFLKRSSSLFRRSLRKPKKERIANQEQMSVSMSPGSLTNIVQQINETLIAVATFGDESSTTTKSVQESIITQAAFEENFPFKDNLTQSSTDFWQTENDFEVNVGTEEKKTVGLKDGLRRRASKLASKFQRASSRSIKLKNAASIDSFPTAGFSRHRSSSLGKAVEPSNVDVSNRLGKFRRTMSFKKARKGMQKAVVRGASSFGKSMMHASAVMPVAYEYPPVTYYPDYEANSPSELEQCYYRTLSYQPRENNLSKSHGQYARPTSFYQHGYCYNG